MNPPRTSGQWSLGLKLALVATPFLLLTLLAIGATLWVSWQLEGGAAAVNEAGRLRMQTYRLTLSLATADDAGRRSQVEEFEDTISLLRRGDPERPLFVPWDDTVRARFAKVERDWLALRRQMHAQARPQAAALRAQAADFVADIDALVDAVEAHMSRWTALQHLLQTAVLALALAAGAALLLTGYRFVLEPLSQLKRAIERLQGGDFDTRIQPRSNDEFSTVAAGFNQLAGQLQSVYRNLEAKVAEKTSQLQEKGERLQALYDVSTLIASATTLDELAKDFTQRITRVARADAVALRWLDEDNQRYLLLASQGLPQPMIEMENCLKAGDCECGVPQASAGVRVIPVHALPRGNLGHCTRADFKTMIALPVRLHERAHAVLQRPGRAFADRALAARSAGRAPERRHGEPAAGRPGQGGRGVGRAQPAGARAARLDRAIAGLPQDPGAADARCLGQRRRATQRRGAGRDRHRRARELRRRARVAAALSHPR